MRKRLSQDHVLRNELRRKHSQRASRESSEVTNLARYVDATGVRPRFTLASGVIFLAHTSRLYLLPFA